MLYKGFIFAGQSDIQYWCRALLHKRDLSDYAAIAAARQVEVATGNSCLRGAIG